MPMRQLRSCDFCGADADGVYEVLPPELSPAEGEQRRVVLCGDCLDTLGTVVEPLLDRLGVESGSESESGGAAERGRSERGRDERGQSERGDDDGATDSLGSNSPMVAGRDSDDGLSEEASDTVPDDHEEDRNWTADPETSGIADATDEEAGTSLQEAAAADAGEREGTDDGGESASDASATDEEPPQFRKVMRLLNNRQFPVERTEVEELAAGAYDLENDHVRDIIDYAVERGVLADDDGTLKRS